MNCTERVSKYLTKMAEEKRRREIAIGELKKDVKALDRAMIVMIPECLRVPVKWFNQKD